MKKYVLEYNELPYDNEAVDFNKIFEDWSRKSNKSHSSMHSISYYHAMFAPNLPKFFINKYTKEGEIVMDNFSGRGTTGLVARELKRNFIGSDLNPIAYVLSRSKISSYTKSDFIERVMELSNEFKKKRVNYISRKYEELKYYYSDYTLKQLIFLRNKIGVNWQTNSDIDNAILAISSGLMHGQVKKDGSSIYFSLDMPNTYSLSPNYVKKYSLSNNLEKPKINIFKNIIKRIENKFDDIISQDYNGKVFLHNATEEFKEVENESVSLIITSPPYLNVVNYVNDNWLKLWLLGFDRTTTMKKINLSDRLNFDKYLIFIEKY